MKRIRMALVGRTRHKDVEAICADYRARIGHHATIEELVISEAKAGDPEAVKRMEGDGLLRKLEGQRLVIALDEKGRSMSSEGFSTWMSDKMNQGHSELAVALGGAHGLDERVRKRADIVLSLSAMTFPHQLVRAIFYEQLYRAFTIMRGEPYHH